LWPQKSGRRSKMPSNEGLGVKSMERETGFEPATSTLARSHSTTELLPLGSLIINEGLHPGKRPKVTSTRHRYPLFRGGDEQPFKRCPEPRPGEVCPLDGLSTGDPARVRRSRRRAYG